MCGPNFQSVGLVNYICLWKRGLMNWNFLIWGLRAKILAKIEAEEAKIFKFCSIGSLVNWLLSSFAWNGTLANYERGGLLGCTSPYPLSRSVPPSRESNARCISKNRSVSAVDLLHILEWTEFRYCKILFWQQGLFEQNLPKVTLIVHLTLDQYLLTGVILWKFGANRS